MLCIEQDPLGRGLLSGKARDMFIEKFELNP